MRICGAATSASPDEMAATDAAVDDAPDDPELRVRAVGAHYLNMSPESATKSVEHLLWLSSHRPDIDLGGFAFVPDDVRPATKPGCTAGSPRTLRTWTEMRISLPPPLR
jgi:hypothetical protein